MHNVKCSIGMAILFSIFIVSTLTAAAAGREAVLYSFKANDADGSVPYSSLVADASGNLYGTTFSGGANLFYGTVFELTPGTGGSWTMTVLHSFKNDGRDGTVPTAGLVFDASGNLYGTTTTGGHFNDGTVFKLAPVIGGAWTETIVHAFNGNDGLDPMGALIFDATGNMYGTTGGGGVYDSGTVFELSPTAGAEFSETILHSFNSNTKDGNFPTSALVRDTAGHLYGTAYKGGANGVGMVFELSPAAGGTWTYKALHEFGSGNDGKYPFVSLILDATGNLYGTTVSGGAHLDGTVFELSPAAGGSYSEKVLHSFPANITDGVNPIAPVAFDSAGNLYGTTQFGGAFFNGGTVFEVSPATGGGWTESVPHSFNYTAGDGRAPSAGLLVDSSGGLYGTTANGGANDIGIVFKVVP